METKYPYNNVTYWEIWNAKTDLWRGVFPPQQNKAQPLFLNTMAVCDEGETLSCDWVCYPDARSALGFMQHVFLPQVFHGILHNSWKCACTPLLLQRCLRDELPGCPFPLAHQFSGLMEAVNGLWGKCDACLPAALMEFAHAFNRVMRWRGGFIHLGVYPEAQSIAGHVREVFWCEEVLQEETGVTQEHFDLFCRLAQHTPLYRAALLHFLNNNMGPLV